MALFVFCLEGIITLSIQTPVYSDSRHAEVPPGSAAQGRNVANRWQHTPGLHNKIPAYKILARGWVAQEPICS